MAASRLAEPGVAPDLQILRSFLDCPCAPAQLPDPFSGSAATFELRHRAVFLGSALVLFKLPMTLVGGGSFAVSLLFSMLGPRALMVKAGAARPPPFGSRAAAPSLMSLRAVGLNRCCRRHAKMSSG